jgi:hypothetical protein
MKRNGNWVLPLILFAMSLHEPLCGQPAESILKISPQCKPGSVSGWDGQLQVRVAISPQYHINSNKPTLDFLIPTQLRMQSTTGAVLGTPAYPKGKEKRFAFTEQPISVYEGTIEIRIPYRILPSRLGKNLPVQGILAFQACTENACLPPKEETFRAELLSLLAKE